MFTSCGDGRKIKVVNYFSVMVQSHGSKTPFNKFCILTTTVIISLIIQSRYNNKAELKSYFAVTHIIVAVILSPNLLTISHISLFLSLQQIKNKQMFCKFANDWIRLWVFK